MRNFLVALLVPLLMACGHGYLVTAHTSISAGCVAAATYAGEHNAVTDDALTRFQTGCSEQLTELERWHGLETPDGGAE